MTLEKNIIGKIENSIIKKLEVFTSMGVTNGLAGVSLFHYYKYETDCHSDYELEKCIHYLESAIAGLNEDYKGPNIVTDILEIAELLDFYVQKDVLDIEDAVSYFDSYEPILESFLSDYLYKNILSPVFGALSFASYFVSKKKIRGEMNADLLLRTLDKIEELSIIHPESDGIYWMSNIKRENEYLIELGIKHGVMGIVDFLAKLYSVGLEKQRTLNLIRKAMNFMIHFKQDSGKALFPFSAEKTPDGRSFSFGTIYGDLGIAYGFYKAGELCNMDEYKKTACEILLNSCNYRDNEGKVTDANLLYGSLGISSLLELFKKKIDSPELDESLKYWYSRTNEYNLNDNEWAGFDSTFNKFDINAQLSFGHGIVGIGIALLNFEGNLNFDFLRFMNYDKLE